jgi:hypothetical protein
MVLELIQRDRRLPILITVIFLYFFLPAHQEGEEEGNKETHTKEDRIVVPK